MDNQTIARKLATYARQLDREPGNLYRIKAYRRAAESIERLTMPVSELIREKGIEGLRELPGIGDHLAFAIERLNATGEFHGLGLDTVAPAEDVNSLPGVGPHLAEMLWEKLHIRTVAELEQAMRDHQIEQLPLGEKRRQHLQESLRQRQAEAEQTGNFTDEPGAPELLWVDREYRRLAKKNQLPTVPSGKGNPFGDDMLPLYFVRRRGWKFTATFANTALAHRLGRNRDWVVIYFSNDTHRGQRTVVTEHRGERRGQRVVRGREAVGKGSPRTADATTDGKPGVG